MDSGVFDRHDAVLAKESQQCRQEQTREAQEHADFPNTEGQVTVEEVRVNHPVDIRVLHH